MATNFSNLTFDEIKNNLKDFLRQQSEFTDYDFEGSALNILLDELAYFGQYMGFYTNLMYQEGNLTTATKRENVVRKAKELSYFPKQKRSPQAVINLSIDLSNETEKPDDILVPRGTNFISEKQEGSYNFITVDDFNLYDENNDGVYEGQIEIQEGNLVDYSWTFDIEKDQRFIIPNPNVDERFLNVFIESVQRTTTETWNYAKNIVGITNEDRIYFLQEVENDKIEIEFTNSSNIGMDLNDGDGIKVNYLITEGENGNGCTTFELIDDISGYSLDNFKISTINRSSGGSDKESKESIRQLAPVNYMAQNRAVNFNDYKVLVQSNFPFVETINVWGGEDNDPPQYGKVFISLKPDYGFFVGANIREQILEFLQDYKVVAVKPEIIDPEYIYIDLDMEVFYDSFKTSLNTQQIKNNISERVKKYFSNNVLPFGNVLWQSKLTSFIDDIEDGYIISNRYFPRINRKIVPTPDVSNNFTLKFVNPLTSDRVIESNIFGDNYQLKDDSKGNVHLYQNDILIKEEQGTVDYEKGEINLIRFTPRIEKNDIVEIKATPKYRDIFSEKNFLLSLENVSVDLKTQ